eukprot:7257020-Pyramimonas_sp.AAC.1
MGMSDWLSLEAIGGPKISALVSTCAAARMRCALVSLPRSWQPLLRRLRHVAEHHGPLSALDSSSLSLSPPFWAMDAIAALMGHAAEGFPGTQRPRER